jgi:hypothetical protein
MGMQSALPTMLYLQPATPLVHIHPEQITPSPNTEVALWVGKGRMADLLPMGLYLHRCAQTMCTVRPISANTSAALSNGNCSEFYAHAQIIGFEFMEDGFPLAKSTVPGGAAQRLCLNMENPQRFPKVIKPEMWHDVDVHFVYRRHSAYHPFLQQSYLSEPTDLFAKLQPLSFGACW